MCCVYKALWDKRKTDSLQGTVERARRQSLFYRNFIGSHGLPLQFENMFPMKKYWTQYVSLKAHKGALFCLFPCICRHRKPRGHFTGLFCNCQCSLHKRCESFVHCSQNTNSYCIAQCQLGHVLNTPQPICSSWQHLIVKRVLDVEICMLQRLNSMFKS